MGIKMIKLPLFSFSNIVLKIIFITIFFSTQTLLAMDISNLDFSRRANWSKSGYPGNLSKVLKSTINVKNYGVDGKGTKDDYQAIQELIDNTPPPSIISFPTGKYRFSSV